MQIECWSDFVCPFCYIGKRRLENALNRFGHRDKVKMTFKSFELAPALPRDGNPDTYDMLAAKYGISREQAKATTANVANQARQVGLTFDFDRAIQTNTFDAHRLAHFAAQQGKQTEWVERLFRAHFTEGKHLGNRDELVALAAEVGLDPDQVRPVLEKGAHAAEVRKDEQEASSLGVRGVPFFVFNRQFAVSGAQPEEVFLEALRKAWGESRPFEVVGGDADAACTDDGCIVPNGKGPNP